MITDRDIVVKVLAHDDRAQGALPAGIDGRDLTGIVSQDDAKVGDLIEAISVG